MMWLESLSYYSSSSDGGSSISSSRLPLRSVVEDVQTPATGGNYISNEFGALGADVSQRAAMGVQVGELLFHRAMRQVV